jgi:DNA damage-inducible protein 1
MRIKQHYLSKPAELHYILHQDPELANAIVADDDIKLKEIISHRMKEQMDKKKKELEKMNRLMSADPTDAAAQKEIEEEIR